MYSKVPGRLGYKYCVPSHNAVVENEALILTRGLLDSVMLVHMFHIVSWLHAFVAN